MSKKEIDTMAQLFNNLSNAQRNLEEVLIEVLPDTYVKPVHHLNNAQIEVLKAVQSMIDNRINGLESLGDELEKKSKKPRVRKEKVEVE
jgi:prefoldin subunit 5